MAINNTKEQKELLSIIERLEQSKGRIAEAAGALKQVQSQLKSRFGCVSFKDAQTKLEQLGQEIQQEQAKFAKGLSKLYQEVEEQGL